MSKGKMSRRKMIGSSAAALAGGAAVLGVPEKARAGRVTSSRRTLPAGHAPLSPGRPGTDYTPVVTPNNVSLPWKIVNGAKVYHLVAEEVDHEFRPGLRAHTWGYNGHTPGPTIEAVEGDRVRIYVTNRLSAPTTVHWHGILLPNGMDGVSGVTQPAIEPGQTFLYEFTLRQHGTYMYHSHHNTMVQEGMGLNGMFVIHPRRPRRPRADRDFVILLHEWDIIPGTWRPDPFEMTDFNIFTMNARVFPGTEPLVVEQGQRVRIRIGNLSAMDHHPIHLHGYEFPVVAIDGADVPESAQVDHVTTLVSVGTTRDIEFIADAPGDWVMHCHMTHHMMNQMGHDLPNMIGVEAGVANRKVRDLLPNYMSMDPGHMRGAMMMDMPKPENTIPMFGGPGPFGLITMSGMSTILKVRESLADYDNPGWYDHPPGTVASTATPAQLRRDGIDPAPSPTSPGQEAGPHNGHSGHSGHSQ